MLYEIFTFLYFTFLHLISATAIIVDKVSVSCMQWKFKLYTQHFGQCCDFVFHLRYCSSVSLEEWTVNIKHVKPLDSISQFSSI